MQVLAAETGSAAGLNEMCAQESWGGGMWVTSCPLYVLVEDHSGDSGGLEDHIECSSVVSWAFYDVLTLVPHPPAWRGFLVLRAAPVPRDANFISVGHRVSHTT